MAFLLALRYVLEKGGTSESEKSANSTTIECCLSGEEKRLEEF